MIESPIMGFNASRSLIVEEVVKRTSDAVKDPLFCLNDPAYQEIRRLSSSHSEELAGWRSLAASLGRMRED
ncbi:MAG: hypothetical protein ABIP89_17720, partial [Polyangiaceae bacterium]